MSLSEFCMSLCRTTPGGRPLRLPFLSKCHEEMWFFQSGRLLGVPRGCPFGKAVPWAVGQLVCGHGPGYSCPAQPVQSWSMNFISVPKVSRAGMCGCHRRRHWRCSRGAGGSSFPTRDAAKPLPRYCPGRAMGAVHFAKPFGILQDKRLHLSVNSFR